MEVTLLATAFSMTSGVPRYASTLSEGLKKYCSIKIIDTRSSSLIRVPPSLATLKDDLYFLLHSKELKNKNLHVLEQGILPKKYLSLPKKKILTIHDLFFHLDKAFMKTLQEGTPLKRKLIDNTLWKLRAFRYKQIVKTAVAYDYVISTSEIIRDFAIKYLGVSKNKITIIYPMVETKFRPLPSKKSNKIIIGYLNGYARADRLKMLKAFILIFKTIKDDSLELRLYGRGFPLQNLIKEDKRIKYLGFVPEERIVKITNTFDVFLSTSLKEGFGYPIMQAKSCKIPVLSYNGYLPEIVKRNTLLWDESNINSLIERRAWEKVNLEKAHRDVEACRPKVVAKQTFDIYKKVFD